MNIGFTGSALFLVLALLQRIIVSSSISTMSRPTQDRILLEKRLGREQREGLG
jgi:hypothetical protein